MTAGPMNPKVKKLWVAALRGGEYQQGNNFLHRVGGGMCCLGVLCALAVKNGVIPEPVAVEEADVDGGSVEVYRYGKTDVSSGDASIIYLPNAVADWSGAHVFGDLPQAGWVSGESLSILNDAGRTFEEIADIIEAEY